MQSKYQPLMIDGSQGEGGGQILRSALTLSMLLQRPFELYNIRAGRAKPGLLRQHLTCVQAAARICQAHVIGDSLGSNRLSFTPGPVRAGQYDFAIGSAGSTSLVLQTILLPLASAHGTSQVRVQGGTHNGQAPSTDFLQRSFLPLLARMGLKTQLTLQQYGFYPAGGGEVCLTIEPNQQWLPLTLLEPIAVATANWTVIAAEVPTKVRNRLAQFAIGALKIPCNELQRDVSSQGPGILLQGSAAQGDDFEVLFEQVGVRGVSASQVANTVASAFQQWLDARVAIDEHLADQLLLPLALSGSGCFTTTAPSQHCLSNIEVIRQFGLANFVVKQLEPQRWEISCVSAAPSALRHRITPTNTVHESADGLR